MNPVLWMTINYRVHCSVNVQQHPVISAPIRQSSIGCESTGQEVMHDNRLSELFSKLGALVHFLRRSCCHIEVMTFAFSGFLLSFLNGFGTELEAIPPPHEGL